MENLWRTIAVKRGVDIGEEFVWTIINGLRCKCIIKDDGFYYSKNNTYFGNIDTASFIAGEGKIEKLPWLPKDGEKYYYIDVYNNLGFEICNKTWEHAPADLLHLSMDNVFRTHHKADMNILAIREKIEKLKCGELKIKIE